MADPTAPGKGNGCRDCGRPLDIEGPIYYDRRGFRCVGCETMTIVFSKFPGTLTPGLTPVAGPYYRRAVWS